MTIKRGENNKGGVFINSTSGWLQISLNQNLKKIEQVFIMPSNKAELFFSFLRYN